MNWLDGTYEEAMQLVAERALYARTKLAETDRAEAIERSHSARQELGILGTDESRINEAMTGLRKGTMNDNKARALMHSGVPGLAKQVHNMPKTLGPAIKQFRLGDIADQLDVTGIKNINPWGSRFHLPTALASLGAYSAHRVYHSDPSAFKNLVPEKVRNAYQSMPAGAKKPLDWAGRVGHNLLSRGKPVIGKNKQLDISTEKGLGQRAYNIRQRLGGAGPLISAMLPSMYREWISRRGYRSGGQPIDQLIEANKVLNKR